MRCKAPKVTDKIWESMINVRSWFKLNKITVYKYFEYKNPSCNPAQIWWAEIMIIYHFAVWVTITFKHLKGPAVTVSVKRSCLASLQALYFTSVDGKGTFPESDANRNGGKS